jgi:hypothetical protein
MEPRSIQRQPEKTNFDHTTCYRDNLHENTKAGRRWCRRSGPASRSGRIYAVSAKRGKKSVAKLEHSQQTAEPMVDEARERRIIAAKRYQPEWIKLLLVAEAPPRALHRYFYFSDVTSHDSLFRYVARSILHVEPTRQTKPELLEQLRRAGVFLIDLKQDSVDGTRLEDYVPDLVSRIRTLNPEKIILIKATVHDAAYTTLADAAFPVVSERVPFPGSGQQKRFEQAFARALDA